MLSAILCTANNSGEYGIRLEKSPPIATVGDRLTTGNAASGKGEADLRVDP